MEGLIELLVPIAAVMGVFGMPVFIVWMARHFSNKKKELFHASLQKLIDSGQEMNPESLRSIPVYLAAHWSHDIKTGAVLIGIGLGVVLLGYFGLSNRVVWSSGLLVAILGAGFFGYGLDAKKDDLETDRYKLMAN